MPSEVEIGVWVEGVQKWVTGVTRRTSCHDIIKALLRAQSLPAQDSDVNDYVIVERWRKVERPLDHEQRILKVWKTWGEAINEVRFTLRRIRSDGNDSETGSRVERSRRRHKWRQTSNGLHPKGNPTQGTNQGMNQGTGCKKTGSEDSKMKNDTMERLMRLVVAQGETIQTQLRRMQERDQQIENFEHQLHLLRVQSLGSDYLLQSYLKEPPPDFPQHNQETHPFSKDELLCEEKSNDSGVVTEEVPESDVRPPHSEKVQPIKQTDCLEDLEDVRARTLLLDKLEKVLIQLLEHEQSLSKLEESLAESTVCEMTQIEEEIANATLVHASTVANARQNEQKLRELDVVVYQRRTTLEALLEEDARYEEEALALQAHLDYIIHLPPTAFKLPDEGHTTEFRPLSTNSFKSLTLSPNKTVAPPPPKPVTATTTLPPSINCKTNPQSINPKEKYLFISSSIPKICPKEATPTLKSNPKVNTSPSDVLSVKNQAPPPPDTSPPPLDEDDDKDSGKTNSLCVSSRSSTSSDSSRGGASPCEGPSSKSSPKTSPSESSKDVDSTDSNSDTGLSSLHSSSDEGAYVLDTLV